jgi:hypothetical protein
MRADAADSRQTACGFRPAAGGATLSRANVLSFLSLNLARLASFAIQLSPIRRQLSNACARMQAGGHQGSWLGFSPSNLHRHKQLPAAT